MTLKHLILISTLQIEDPLEARITEVAIMNNITTDEVKQMTLDMIEVKLKELDFLYNYSTIPPIAGFTLDGVDYTLPVDLGSLTYGKWEDLQRVLKNSRFGDNDWEKFRYILNIIADPNYNASTLEEDSKKFLNLPAQEVLGLINFFTRQEKQLLNYMLLYSRQIKKMENLRF